MPPSSRIPGLHTWPPGRAAGSAWGCALRGWMIAFAGSESTVTWVGTFGGVVAPAGLVGGLLGWAQWRNQHSLTPSGWLVAAPLVLGLAPLAVPGVLSSLVETGQGSGAPAMVSLAMLAGYLVSGRGSRRRRGVAGVLGFGVAPAVWLAPAGSPALDPTVPSGALVALTFSTLYVCLAAACAIPMRAALPTTQPVDPGP